LESIEENIGYINKIVADLQDFARPLQPEYDLVNVPDLVVSVLQAMCLPENVMLSINISDLSIIKTDSHFLRRALTNLVNNAIQAMPNGGDLTIKASKTENITIYVEDTGVGIPEDVKPKLFTPMMTTKSKGQGLGLAVVKRLIEALGGAIMFESQEGKGTKFTITLPNKT
jgi:signal transduction histidine kinase